MADLRVFFTTPTDIPNTPCVKLISPNINLSKTYYFPYTGIITLSAQQTYVQPVRDFFGWAGETIRKAIGLPSFRMGETNLTDILGFKLYNKNYFINAWQGSTPSTFSLNIKLAVGILDKWSGRDEVYNPIMDVFQQTIPSEGVQLSNRFLHKAIKAPSTNVLGAFKAFGEEYLNGITTEITLSQGDRDTEVEGSWTVEFGCTGNRDFSSYLSLSNYVVTDASYTFANRVDDIGYPIEGELKLTFKSQAIPVQSDFGPDLT